MQPWRGSFSSLHSYLFILMQKLCAFYACFWVTVSILYFYYKDYLGFVTMTVLCRRVQAVTFAALFSEQQPVSCPELQPGARETILQDARSPGTALVQRFQWTARGTKASIPPSCLSRRRQRMWRVDNCMLECLFYSDMSSCAFSCVWGLAEKVEKVSIQLRYDVFNWMKQ